MIIAGAALIMLVLDRFPILVWLGAMLLGWIAGDVIDDRSGGAARPATASRRPDRARLDATSTIFGISPHIRIDADLVEYICSMLGAIAVLVVGSIWRKRKLRKLEHLALPADARKADRHVSVYRRTIEPERPTSRASCLKRLPTRSATRSTMPVLEHQHQLAAVAAEVRRRQHARPRRRDQMRDAERGAEQPGALDHRRRHQLAG